MSDQHDHPIGEVPQQIFEGFLEELKTSGISVELIERLTKVLLEKHDISESAIRAALLPDDQNP